MYQQNTRVHKAVIYLSSLFLLWGGFLFSGCGNVGNPFGATVDNTYVIEHITPADNATGVSVNTLITIAFPVDMDESTIQPGNITLQLFNESAVSVSMAYDDGDRILTIRPSSALQGNSSYQLVLFGLRSASGISFASQTFTFYTGNGTPDGQPEIISVTPLPMQEELVASTVVKVVFSEAMNKTTAEQAFSISNGVTGAFSWSADSKEMTFTPGSPLASGTTFSVTVLDSAQSINGINLKTGISWFFKTKAEARFIVIESTPADGATTVSPDVTIRYTLSSPVDRTTVTTNFVVTPSMTVDSTTFSYDQNDQVIIYTPPAPISAGTVVSTTWETGLMSTQDQLLAEEYSISFTIENIPPDVTLTEPANGATGVAANQEIRFTFNEPLNISTVNSSTFIVEQPAGSPVSGTISFENNNRIVVFTADNPFSGSGGAVVVTATTGIEDLGGTAIASDIVISFTIDDTLPVLTSSVPSNGDTDVVPDTIPTLIMDFSKELNQSAFEGSFSITPSGGGGTFSWSSSTSAPRVQYTTSEPLSGATLYTVSFTMIDIAGNSSPGSFSFTVDNTPPFAYPPVLEGADDVVNVDSNITIVFSERMQRDTVEDSFSYTNGVFTWDINDGTVTWDPDDTYSNTMIFNPNSNFFTSTEYTVSVTSGALDVGGLGLSPALNATFTTTSTP